MTHSLKVSDSSKDTRLSTYARFAALEEMIAVAEANKAREKKLAFIQKFGSPNRAA